MSLSKIARNKHRDELYDVLGPVADRVISEKWDVYVHQDRFERMLTGRKASASLMTYSLLKPQVFEGFARTIVASACFEDTMFYRLFAAQGIDLKPVGKSLHRDLRYERHENGEHITIFYVSEEAWSKTYRDKLVEAESGGSVQFCDIIRAGVGDLFCDDPFLWMGNKDIEDDFFNQPRAQRLPNTPHGLNGFQSFHNIVVLSALNAPPAHFHFMEGQGVSGEEMRTAHYRTAVYQAVMRSSIRNPADTTPKRVVVMDRATAEWLADLFPGAKVEPLPGMGVVPRKGKPGRRRKHDSAADKTRAYRESQKRKYLAELDLINGTSLVVGKYPWFDEEVRSQMSEFRCDENTSKKGDYVTQKPSTSGTAFVSVFDNVPLAHLSDTDDEGYIAFLRDLHGRVLAQKENAGVFSPAHFDPDKAAETKRGLDNITHLRGIWLDNDGGDLSHAEFARLFPYLRIVTWNTYSHTPEKPRWRGFIPTTCAMSIEVHRLIMAQIEWVLNREGYWGKKQIAKRPGLKSPLCHGFDESKFNAASLFYLPCQARDPKDSFFIDYGAGDPKRGPLDLHLWIENCILDLRPDPAPETLPDLAKAVEPVTTVIAANISDRLGALRDKLLAERTLSHSERCDIRINEAVKCWRSTPAGMGHDAFFALGAALHRAGLEEAEIKAKLYEEAAFANSPRERRDEIRDILKSLHRRGTLGKAKRW
ncbi:hypothetical protein [Salinarimonas rosea]|uniref:hypothetical protein n=1 Tax=Salinarimonas rosea TaxID=552063 RepID=UPI000428D14B|nr:hypothetical protein [Salinarimonas rosea]